MTTGGRGLKVFRLFFPGNFLNDVFLERQHFNNAVKCFREARGRRRIERLIDAGEDSAIEQNFQNFLGADVEFFRKIADRHPFGDRNFARLARWRRGRALDVGGAPLAGTHPGAHRMQLALAFLKALLHRGAGARGRLAFIDWLAGLRLRGNFVGRKRGRGSPSGPGCARSSRHG